MEGISGRPIEGPGDGTRVSGRKFRSTPSWPVIRLRMLRVARNPARTKPAMPGSVPRSAPGVRVSTQEMRSESSSRKVGMIELRSVTLRRSAILRTDPTCTPRKVTGAPTVRPATEVGKNTTARKLGVNRRRPPNNRMARTASVRPPSTKLPTAAGLAFTLGLHRHQELWRRGFLGS